MKNLILIATVMFIVPPPVHSSGKLILKQQKRKLQMKTGISCWYFQAPIGALPA